MEETSHPALVSHSFGAGRAIYSAADIESLDAEAPGTLFTGVVKQLLNDPPSYATDAPPAVWMNVQVQPQNRRLIVSFLNYQAQTPIIPIPCFTFSLKPPRGETFVAFTQLPEERANVLFS